MMKTILRLATICVLSSAPALRAQVDTLWTRSFGENGRDCWDFGESVLETMDGGYIITGVTGADVTHVSDVYLIKTDASGYVQWTRTIGRSQTEGRDYGISLQQTEDDGYILTGFTELLDGNLLDIYLVKTDDQGDTLWTRTYGDTLSESGNAVLTTPDGGYVIAGYTSAGGARGADLLLAKTDDSGEIEWWKTYGGLYDDYGYSVERTPDGGFVVVGTTHSYGSGDSDIYTVRTDESGDTLWTRTFGGADKDDGFSIKKASSGGYIIAGTTESFGAGMSDVYLLRIDDSGDTLWTRTIGGGNLERGFSVAESGEGNYIVTGNAMSFGGGDDDIYLIKVNDDGTVLWSKVFDEALDQSGQSIHVTADGGYIIAGFIGSYYGSYWDVYLVKTTPDAVGVERDGSHNSVLPRSFSLEQNFPNPFNPTTLIQYEIPDIGQGATMLPVDLNVYDIRGRLVRTLLAEEKGAGIHRVEWNGKDERGKILPSGVYFYRIRIGDFTDTRKMTLIK